MPNLLIKSIGLILKPRDLQEKESERGRIKNEKMYNAYYNNNTKLLNAHLDKKFILHGVDCAYDRRNLRNQPSLRDFSTEG